MIYKIAAAVLKLAMRMPYSLPPITVLSLFLSATAMGQAKITVGPNLQVSQARADRDHFEVRMAVDPSLGRMLACSMMVPAVRSNRMFDPIADQSKDDGESWRPLLEKSLGGATFGRDCAYGIDGSVLVTIRSGRESRVCNYWAALTARIPINQSEEKITI